MTWSYLKLDEVMSLDEAALRRRLAKGAEASIQPVGREDEQNLKELLGKYINALDAHEQKQEAQAVRRLLSDWRGVCEGGTEEKVKLAKSKARCG